MDTLLVLAGDHIYKMDYRPMLRFHEQNNADCTVAVRRVSPHDTYRFGIVGADTIGRVTRFEEKPRRSPKPAGLDGNLRVSAVRRWSIGSWARVLPRCRFWP